MGSQRTSGAGKQHRAPGGAFGNTWYVEIVWFVLGAGLCVAMFYAAFRLEPHWSSKDGKRFMGMAQQLDQHSIATGRFRETRVIVLADGSLQVDQKRMMRRRTIIYRMEGTSPDPPRKKQVYVLRARDTLGSTTRLALRVPTSSRCVPVLDELVAKATQHATVSPQNPAAT